MGQVEISKSEMSDHDLIELTTTIKNGKNQTRKMEKKENMSVPNFWQLNFHDENFNWEIINELVRRIPWEILFKDKDTETCTIMLLEILLKVCIKYIPIRKAKGNNNIPRERKRLFNRIKSLFLSLGILLLPFAFLIGIYFMHTFSSISSSIIVQVSVSLSLKSISHGILLTNSFIISQFTFSSPCHSA